MFNVCEDGDTINSILNNNSLTVDLQNKYFGNYYRGENNWEIINEPNSSEYDNFLSTPSSIL